MGEAIQDDLAHSLQLIVPWLCATGSRIGHYRDEQRTTQDERTRSLRVLCHWRLNVAATIAASAISAASSGSRTSSARRIVT